MDKPRATEAELRTILRRDPQAHWAARLLGDLLLRQGRYEEGFAWFEARHQLPEMAKPALPFPEWRGEDIAGKRLLVWPEQGFGDQIQFARFAPVLKARGAQVTWLCRPPLARLFEGCLGVQVLAAHGEVSFPDPDYWVMTCSLAWRLGYGPETLPNAPYLHALEKAPPLGPGLRVGLMTRGNPAHDNDSNRSLDAEAARALQALPARIVDLHPQATGAKDFAETAAIVEGLDLVISVDTAVAHLAGAMGKPCWVLLPATHPDWRWMEGRSDSPWYRSLRLYRQTEPGAWTEPLRRIHEDVIALVSAPAAGGVA
jgi:hypothetical protein